jgi:folate-binding protein YgfZ
VRHASAWRDRSREGHVEVTGTDRVAWLQGLLTNDVAALRPGDGCYAAYLTPQGRMLSDVRVLAFDAACRLDLPAAAFERVLRRLEMFIITEDVVLRDLSGEVARLAVHGPASPETLGQLLGSRNTDLAAALAALPEHHHVAVNGPAGRIVVAGTRELGVPGFDVYVPASERVDLSRRMTAAGLPEIDADTWTACRIEAGRPEYGADMDEETIPLEAGIESRAISFTKGCYVGQEVIVRVRDRGQGRVARRLVGLAASEDAGTRDALRAGDTLVDDEREVGRITSGAFSPALRCPVALGYVHRDSAAPGRRLRVRTADGDAGVTVTPLPFLPYDPGVVSPRVTP